MPTERFSFPIQAHQESGDVRVGKLQPVTTSSIHSIENINDGPPAQLLRLGAFFNSGPAESVVAVHANWSAVYALTGK